MWSMLRTVPPISVTFPLGSGGVSRNGSGPLSVVAFAAAAVALGDVGAGFAAETAPSADFAGADGTVACGKLDPGEASGVLCPGVLSVTCGGCWAAAKPHK